MKKQTFQVTERRTSIEVPHLEGKLVFAYPEIKGDNYFDVREQLNEANLRMPTFAETISFLASAWENPEGKYESEVLEKLIGSESHGKLVTNTAIISSDTGVYVIDEPVIIANKPYWEKESELVEQASYLKYRRTCMSPREGGTIRKSELAEDPLVAELSCKEKSLKKLSELVKKYRDNPRIFRHFDDSEDICFVNLSSRYCGESSLQIDCNNRLFRGFGPSTKLYTYGLEK